MEVKSIIVYCSLIVYKNCRVGLIGWVLQGDRFTNWYVAFSWNDNWNIKKQEENKMNVR